MFRKCKLNYERGKKEARKGISKKLKQFNDYLCEFLSARIHNDPSLSFTSIWNRFNELFTKELSEKFWIPEDIRAFIDSAEYGSDEEYAIPSNLLNDPSISKTIWLTKDQAEKWDPDQIKKFLILKGCTLPTKDQGFREEFKILAEMFNIFMKGSPEFKKKVINYRKSHKNQFETLQKGIMRLK